MPIRQLRYPLIDSLSEVAQSLVNNALVRSGSNSVEQSGRYRMLGSKSRFTYTTWAFPAGEFANTALAYKLFCKEYYARTGFRCDMPTVGFRLNRDRSALLSPSFDSPMFTLSPLSTQVDGWDDFVLDFAEFAAKHHGMPFFNQTRNASPEVVAQRFGTRLDLLQQSPPRARPATTASSTSSSRTTSRKPDHRTIVSGVVPGPARRHGPSGRGNSNATSSSPAE